MKWTELPGWGKFIIVVCFFGFFLLGFPSFWLNCNIYSDAPHNPDITTGRVHLVRVMHGSPRYVTASEQARYIFWNDEIGPLTGIPLIICAVTIAIVARRRQIQSSSQNE